MVEIERNLNHSFVRSFIGLTASSFIISSSIQFYSFICSFVHSLIYSYVHSFICLFVHSFICSFVYSFIRSLAIRAVVYIH